MQSSKIDNIIILRLFSNELLIDKIIDVAKLYKIKSGIILSGIGQLKNFQLGFFNQKSNYLIKEFNRPHELLSLSGNICKNNNEYVIHLHVVLGDENKKTVGGHLIKGIVEITNEVFILNLDINLKRKYEENTGLKGLYIE
jgi:predicted DNA-binding protein with PD1-like motif